MICRLKGFVSWLKENYDDYIKKRSPIASSQGAFMSERLDPIAEQKKNRPPSQRGKSEAINNYQLFALSDVGNSERFVYHNQRKARFCHQMGKSGQWFIWDGLRWRPDETNQIRGLAEDTGYRLQEAE